MDLAERPSSDFERHPWELARFRFFAAELRRAGVLKGRQRVLDVGAGDGFFLTTLMDALPGGSTGLGWDLGYEAATVARLGLPRRGQLAFTECEPADRYSLLLLLDVLEHVEEDALFLRERVEKNLAPGGTLLVSVPAWPALYTSRDEALGHFRRYRPAEVLELLLGAGLVIGPSGGLFHVLMLPRAFESLGERLRPLRVHRLPERLEWRAGAALARAASVVLAVDNRLSAWSARHGHAIPGLSYWALCKRPELPRAGASG